MTTTVEAAFEAAVAPLLADPLVGRGRKRHCVDVAGKVFAMVSGGRLVVKLPRARVDELVERGAGDRFRLGGRAMAEWVALPVELAEPGPLVAEARRYVGG